MDISRVLRTGVLPLITALCGVAAIAGAVVLKPSHRATDDYWDNIRQGLQDRSQVDLFDDFRRGLDAWQISGDRGNAWAYDGSGIVSPGRLSFFGPSMTLTDYDLDALVQIDAGALGLVFRARSPYSYQVARLVSEGQGAMASLAVERYAVLLGRRSPAVVTRYPERFQPGFYRVHLKVRDDAFSIYVNDKLVDFWTDARLKAGGIGLFCAEGDRARVAWIRVSHNADFEGQLCAWLSTMLTTK